MRTLIQPFPLVRRSVRVSCTFATTRHYLRPGRRCCAHDVGQVNVSGRPRIAPAELTNHSCNARRFVWQHVARRQQVARAAELAEALRYLNYRRLGAGRQVYGIRRARHFDPRPGPASCTANRALGTQVVPPRAGTAVLQHPGSDVETPGCRPAPGMPLPAIRSRFRVDAAGTRTVTASERPRAPGQRRPRTRPSSAARSRRRCAALREHMCLRARASGLAFAALQRPSRIEAPAPGTGARDLPCHDHLPLVTRQLRRERHRSVACRSSRFDPAAAGSGTV